MNPADRPARIPGAATADAVRCVRISLAILLGTLAVQAGSDYTFTNPAGGNWSNPSNWSPSGVPGIGDTAVLGSGTYTTTLDIDVTVAGLTVSDGSGSPTLSISGRTLNLTSNGIVAAGATLRLTSGTLTGSASLTVHGVMNWAGGTMSGTGQTIIAVLGPLNLSGTADKNLYRTLRNDGTGNRTEGALGMAGTFDNRGSVTANSATLLRCFGNAGVNAFNNSGIMDLQAGTLSLLSSFLARTDSRVRFRLAGLRPQLDHGVLILGGTANLAGTLDVTFAPG